MPTLRAPTGGQYQSDDEAEITNLMLGHGYTVVPDESPDEPAELRGRRTKPPGSGKYAEPIVEGETTD